MFCFEDFINQSDFLENEEVEATRARMVSSAFIGWQLGAGQKKTFSEYLSSLGLVEKEKPLTKQQIKEQTEKALQIAERIRKMR